MVFSLCQLLLTFYKNLTPLYSLTGTSFSGFEKKLNSLFDPLYILKDFQGFLFQIFSLCETSIFFFFVSSNCFQKITFVAMVSPFDFVCFHDWVQNAQN